MKFIKKYKSFESLMYPPIESSAFGEDELNDIKDLYNDIVDDLNLEDVKSTSEMTSPLTSRLNTLHPYRDKIFEVHIDIRTIGQTDSLADRDAAHFLTKKIKDKLIPYVVRFRKIGFSVSMGDIQMKLDSWNFITSGIKIKITK
jgi:hypothetical protein